MGKDGNETCVLGNSVGLLRHQCRWGFEDNANELRWKIETVAACGRPVLFTSMKVLLMIYSCMYRMGNILLFPLVPSSARDCSVACVRAASKPKHNHMPNTDAQCPTFPA